MLSLPRKTVVFHQLTITLSCLSLALRSLYIDRHSSTSPVTPQQPTSQISNKTCEVYLGTPLLSLAAVAGFGPLICSARGLVITLGARKCYPRLWPKMLRTLTRGDTMATSLDDVHI